LQKHPLRGVFVFYDYSSMSPLSIDFFIAISIGVSLTLNLSHNEYAR